MTKNITIEIGTNNLGPHEGLNAKLQMGSIKIGVYANNGSGKTFLSRAFRLTTKQNLDAEDSNKLLTLGKNEGAFKLRITNSKMPSIIRDLEFSLKRNSTPIITKNTTDYIFRVFNDDYIKENLEGLKYKPNGQIEGYILGKEKIDLSNEKENLEKKTSELNLKEKYLKEKVSEAISQLDELSVRKNTGEYKNINFNNLFNSEFSISETEVFQNLIKKHNQLKSLPDNLTDLETVPNVRKTNTTFKISEFLKEEFTPSNIAEDFKLKVKSKQHFVETGISLIDKENSECPFCEQSLTESSLKLIDEYVKYLGETEAEQIKRANDLYSQLISEKKERIETTKLCSKLQIEYLKNQKFIPTLEGINLNEIINIKDLDTHYKVLHEALEKKKENITLKIESNQIELAISEIEYWTQDTNQKIQANGEIVKIFNSRKNNTNAEKLDLNRRLCRAKFIELRLAHATKIQEIIELNKYIKVIKDDIIKKEQNDKISKKKKVVETFTQLLNKFFGNKYSFDENTFCLKFNTHLLESNASDVLSNGEKSIVAFCFFLAETHILINKEEDYEKLFFIIDDPISSQDFHFVYATSQIIRTLNKLFAIHNLRLILFTHNLEFMSIIMRNKIIDQKYILINNKLENLGRELIMPYEEHLRDIYNVSQGKTKPTHTTPNSLRHVLETINKFISPDIHLNIFCERIEGFTENEFLYSLMHDGSHGNIRLQKAYTDLMVKSACEVVVNYIIKDFEGQINIISNN